VHDIWHVLFDVPTTVQGELALKVRRWAHLFPNPKTVFPYKTDTFFYAS